MYNFYFACAWLLYTSQCVKSVEFSKKGLSAPGKVYGKSSFYTHQMTTLVMSRFRSGARVSMATERQQKSMLNRRKQDNIHVNELNSSSDHTTYQLHTYVYSHCVFAQILHISYLISENFGVKAQPWCPLNGLRTDHTLL